MLPQSKDELELNEILDNLSFLDPEDVDDIPEIEKYNMRYASLLKKAEFKAEYFITAMRVAEENMLNQQETSKRIIERMTRYRKTAENKLKYAKQRAFEYCDQMGRDKVEGDFGKYTRQKGSQSVSIPDGYDVSQLPQEFVRTKPETHEVAKQPLLKFLKQFDENEEQKDFHGVCLVRGDDIMVLR